MILLDTHVLVWWLSAPEKLSPEARKLVDSGIPEASLKVSAITAATALEDGWTLVTKDERLRACGFLKTVW